MIQARAAIDGLGITDVHLVIRHSLQQDGSVDSRVVAIKWKGDYTAGGIPAGHVEHEAAPTRALTRTSLEFLRELENAIAAGALFGDDGIAETSPAGARGMFDE